MMMNSWILRLKLRPERGGPEGATSRRAKPGTVMKLSKAELKSHGMDVNHEMCNVCGKDIYFTTFMTRSDYTYKAKKNDKIVYACSYSHFQKVKGR